MIHNRYIFHNKQKFTMVLISQIAIFMNPAKVQVTSGKKKLHTKVVFIISQTSVGTVI